MEKPDAATIDYYDRNVPTDGRAVRGQMFGHPCAFVNGHMFFGTFARTVVVRVGVERAAALARGAARIFEPMPGRAWKEYVQVDCGALPDATLGAWAQEALEATATLPPKAKKAKAAAPATKAQAKTTKAAAPTAKAKAKTTKAAAPAAKAKAKTTKASTPAAKKHD